MDRATKALREWGPLTLIVFGSLWLFQSALAQTKGHGVLIQGANYDAGTVKRGAFVTHNLRLVNLSGQAVEVDPRPGCGCTVVEAPDKALAPLHTETVRAQIDTDGMQPGAEKKAVMLNLRAGGSVWQKVTWIKFQLQ